MVGPRPAVRGGRARRGPPRPPHVRAAIVANRGRAVVDGTGRWAGSGDRSGSTDVEPSIALTIATEADAPDAATHDHLARSVPARRWTRVLRRPSLPIHWLTTACLLAALHAVDGQYRTARSPPGLPIAQTGKAGFRINARWHRRYRASLIVANSPRGAGGSAAAAVCFTGSAVLLRRSDDRE